MEKRTYSVRQIIAIRKSVAARKAGAPLPATTVASTAEKPARSPEQLRAIRGYYARKNAAAKAAAGAAPVAA